MKRLVLCLLGSSLSACTLFVDATGHAYQPCDAGACKAGLVCVNDRCVWPDDPSHDTLAPTLASVEPVSAATGVDPAVVVKATFSEAIDPASVTAESFVLRTSDGLVVGGVRSVSGAVVSFAPSAPLASQATYTALVAGSITDLAGNPAGTAYSWSFTTADVTAPTVSSVEPTSGATGVNPGVVVSATFSEAIAPASVTATSFVVETAAGVVVPGVRGVSGAVASFVPSAPLASQATYTVLLDGSITDLAGNTAGSAYSWTFSTADVTAPTVSSVDPASGATGVAADVVVRATFSEAIDPASVTATSLVLTVASGGAVEGTPSVSGAVVSFTPSAPLMSLVEYIATLDSGVTDLAGNPLGVSQSWSFTIADTTPPFVTAVAPVAGAVGVAAGAKLEATFSEAIAPGSITGTSFVVKTPAGAVVAGARGVSGAVASFVPSSPLASQTTYSATLDATITDLAGNPTGSAYSWTFTTADVTPPTVTATSPGSGEKGVVVDAVVTATFSKPVDPASVSQATLALSPAVAGAVSVDGATVTFTPGAALPTDTIFQATISGVKDTVGNTMAAPWVWSFSTVDTLPPTVATRSPETGAIQVLASAVVQVTFSEAVDASTVTGASFRVTAATDLAGALNVSGATVTFTPNAPLPLETTITVTLDTDIRDLAGNALAAVETWTFRTYDQNPPAIVTWSPLATPNGVSPATLVVVTFDEAVAPATAGGLTLWQDATPVPGTAVAAGSVVTFTPTNQLALGTTYTAKVATTVTDLAANPLVTAFEWGFTTTDNPPAYWPVADPVYVDVDFSALVTLSATATDPNLDPLTYEWTQASGPTVTLTGSTPSFVAPVVVTTQVFYVRAFDGASYSLARKYVVRTWESVARAIYVAPTTSSEQGTLAQPYTSIPNALIAARAKAPGAAVYVQTGPTYNVTDTIDMTGASKLALYGGFGTTWERDLATSPTVITGAPQAVGISGTGVRLDGLQITARSASTAGGSSIVVTIGTATDVTIEGCTLKASSGQQGANGAPRAAPTKPGAAGGDGTSSVCTGTAMAAGGSSPGKGVGGAGAYLTSSGTFVRGANGTSIVGGASGGPGGSSNGASGVAGGSGGVGSTGSGGAASAQLGSFAGALALAHDSVPLYVSPVASAGVGGSTGSPGAGGGGSGGSYRTIIFSDIYVSGNGGGGGGAGGVGGYGGYGGQGGGASIGVLAKGATNLKLVNSTIVATTGGAGGAGAGGTAGATGGTGGAGGHTSACGVLGITFSIGLGGAGGDGGRGGTGGRGGGGSGGPSYGLVYDTTTTWTYPNTKFGYGAGGAGGVGGTNGSTGLSGSWRTF